MIIIAYKDRYYDGKLWVKDKRKAKKFTKPDKAWKYVDEEINKHDEDIYLIGLKNK